MVPKHDTGGGAGTIAFLAVQQARPGEIDQGCCRTKLEQRDGNRPRNVTSLEEARALIKKLPLGQAGLMKDEFIELGPLTPLHLLLRDGGSTAGK